MSSKAGDYHRRINAYGIFSVAVTLILGQLGSSNGLLIGGLRPVVIPNEGNSLASNVDSVEAVIDVAMFYVEMIPGGNNVVPSST